MNDCTHWMAENFAVFFRLELVHNHWTNILLGHRQTEANGQAERVKVHYRCDAQSTQGPCQEGHRKQISRIQES